MSDIYGYTFANGVTHPVMKHGKLMLSSGECCCNGCWLLRGGIELFTEFSDELGFPLTLILEEKPTWRNAHLYVDGYEILRVFPQGDFGAEDIPSCGDRAGLVNIRTADYFPHHVGGEIQPTFFTAIDANIRRGHSFSVDAQCTARCRYEPTDPTFRTWVVIQPWMLYTDLNIKTTVDCGALGVCTSIIPAGTVAPFDVRSNSIAVPQNMDGRIITVNTRIDFYE